MDAGRGNRRRIQRPACLNPTTPFFTLHYFTQAPPTPAGFFIRYNPPVLHVLLPRYWFAKYCAERCSRYNPRMGKKRDRKIRKALQRGVRTLLQDILAAKIGGDVGKLARKLQGKPPKMKGQEVDNEA